MGRNNILVLGGAGFIGSNLCMRLVKDKNNYVICMDNLFTGKKENINECLEYPNFLFIEHDIINRIELDITINNIYNFACPGSPLHYQTDPIFTVKTNFLGTLNALELARANGATLLQASTSEIYGDPLQHPQNEKYWGNVNLNGPRACYDEGKRIAETLCTDYHSFYGVDTKIIRIFNTYGPKMSPNDGRVISNFVFKALKGEPLCIYGNGEQTRSFCYIDDLIDGIDLVMKSSLHGPVNLGNPEEVTIRELAVLIVEKTRSNSALVQKELPIDDPVRRKPDITRAIEKLGWHPRILLNEGLDFVIHYFETLC